MGHLTFQCRNILPKPREEVDISSTSSDSESDGSAQSLVLTLIQCIPSDSESDLEVRDEPGARDARRSTAANERDRDRRKEGSREGGRTDKAGRDRRETKDQSVSPPRRSPVRKNKTRSSDDEVYTANIPCFSFFYVIPPL